MVTVVLPGECGKPRPAVIVQDDPFLALRTTVVVPFTTTITGAEGVRLAIEPDAENGLMARSEAMIDRIYSVPNHKLGYVIGRLGDPALRQVSRALALFLGLSSSRPLPAPPAP